MIESAELFTRGDIATCAIQYGRFPSFLCTQKVPLGRTQFRALLWGSNSGWLPCRRTGGRGCWCSARAWARGPAPTSRCATASPGSTRTASTAPCGSACPDWRRWSKTGMKEGRSPLVPPGRSGISTLERTPRSPRRSATGCGGGSRPRNAHRLVSPRLIFARPHWLASQRGRGVPGELKSFGHDYRADTARFVRAALGLPAVTEEQMQAVERVLESWNSTEASGSAGWPPAAPGPAAPAGGVPLASTTGGTTFCSRSRGTGRPISCPGHVALGHRSTMRG